ncbi:hypothetical protein J0J80_01590 [Turicibacter bilis]|uniref:hypothetical protein n=1 Tax=Turicibacter bilis TaxID=2735723 RepID=UPI001BAE7493|nr:hypothetical protein [Turicibacter bilis]MBS3203748.1 hypothetical protein [Turicibacter bilis]UUF11111.1 hypothetical protein J0J80_01590 [Turicibacter bilis]
MRYYLILLLSEGFISLTTQDILDRELLALFYVVLNVLFFILYFYRKSEDKTLFMILVGGLMLRMAALYYDRNVAWLPFNTTDAQRFHELSVETANALPDVLLEHFTGFYSQVLGVIYYIFGPYQFWGHFLNISFVMLAATKLLDIADLMKLTLTNKKIMSFIWMFAPIPFLMSYALLREGSMYYFVVLSIYYFLKWTKDYRLFNIIMAVLSVYIGSKYHEGVIAVAVPYLYAFVFYDRQKNKIKMNGLNIACITTAFIVFLAFIGSEAGQEYIQKTNAETGGGSAYLTNLKVETPLDFLFAGPIKAVFLVYSPMPWLVRNGMDIITLLLDSSLWIYTTYLFAKNYKTIDSRYKLLMLCIILGGFVYGMGTLNTGTAIRHRNKLMAFTLVLMMAIKNNVDLDYEKREMIE